MYDFDRFGEVTPSNQRPGNYSRRGGYPWQHCHGGSRQPVYCSTVPGSTKASRSDRIHARVLAGALVTTMRIGVCTSRPVCYTGKYHMTSVFFIIHPLVHARGCFLYVRSTVSRFRRAGLATSVYDPPSWRSEHPAPHSAESAGADGFRSCVAVRMGLWR